MESAGPGRPGPRGPVSARLASALALACVLATVGTLAAASAEEPSARPTASDLAAIPTAPQEETPLADADPPAAIPAETPQSEASETEHEDLSSEDAADVAAEEFPEVMEAPGYEGVDPPPGTKVGGYLDDYAAIVEPTGNPIKFFDPDDPDPPAPGGIVVSGALPLRTENEGEHLRPIDTSLVETESGYEQANALAEVRIPEDLSSGIEIAGTGLGVEPSGATGSDAVEIVEDKALYANLAGSPDTDFIAAPMAAGFQFMLQLRSADSPARHRIGLTLPDTAELVRSEISPGGFDVVGSGEMLGTISAPTAFDSAGLEVPVEMRAEGGELVIDLAHLDAGWQFPILVDPVYDYYAWKDAPNPGGQPSDLAGWITASNYPAKFTGYFANGIHSRSNPSTVYPNNAYHQWMWQAPPSTFIERADFYNADNFVLGTDGEVEKNPQGIWGSFGWWETGQSFLRSDGTGGQGTPSDFQPNWATPFSFSWGFEHVSHDQWVGNNRYPDWSYPDSTPYVNWGPDAEGSDRNMAIFGLLMEDTGVPTTRQCCARAQLRGALFSLYDRYPPRLTSLQPTPPTSWVDDTASPNHLLNAAATDQGLGMKAFALHANRLATDGSKRYFEARAPCAGHRYARCAASYSTPITYQLPEGKNTLELIPYDIVGWWQQPWQTWTRRIDRTAPDVQTPSGSLYANRAAIDGMQSYELKLSATDGDTTRPSLMQSGVVKVEVFVDDEPESRFTVEQACPGPDGSCSINSTVTPAAVWTTPKDSLPAGTHTIRIVATDALGRASASRGQQFQVNVAYNDAPIEVVSLCGPQQPSTESVADELLLAVDPEAIDEVGTDLFGARYAEGWISHASCPSMMHVAIRDITPAETADFRQALAADGRVDINRVVINTVAFTEAQLAGDGDKAVDVLIQHSVDPYDVLYDVEAQELTVLARTLAPQTRSEIEAVSDPPVSFVVNPGYAGFQETGPTRTDFPPYEAGLRLSLRGGCTSGFTVVRQGRYSGTSAGHCGGSGDSVAIGGRPAGIVRDDTGPGDRADALRIDLEGREAGRRVHTGPSSHRGVTALIDGGGFDKGRRLCFQGDTSGSHNCGRISFKIAGTSSSGTRDLVCFAEPSAFGDSGGPVYDPRPDKTARAAGIVKGFNPFYDDTCFSKIGQVLRIFDVDLAMRGR